MPPNLKQSYPNFCSTPGATRSDCRGHFFKIHDFRVLCEKNWIGAENQKMASALMKYRFYAQLVYSQLMENKNKSFTLRDILLLKIEQFGHRSSAIGFAWTSKAVVPDQLTSRVLAGIASEGHLASWAGCSNLPFDSGWHRAYLFLRVRSKALARWRGWGRRNKRLPQVEGIVFVLNENKSLVLCTLSRAFHRYRCLGCTSSFGCWPNFVYLCREVSLVLNPRTSISCGLSACVDKFRPSSWTLLNRPTSVVLLLQTA